MEKNGRNQQWPMMMTSMILPLPLPHLQRQPLLLQKLHQQCLLYLAMLPAVQVHPSHQGQQSWRLHLLLWIWMLRWHRINNVNFLICCLLLSDWKQHPSTVLSLSNWIDLEWSFKKNQLKMSKYTDYRNVIHGSGMRPAFTPSPISASSTRRCPLIYLRCKPKTIEQDGGW